jgi:succinyl-diaminopimelate desuccinylase
MSDEIGLLHRWVDDHRDEIVEGLRGCLRIPSIQEPPAGPNAPYGQPVRDALDYTLNLCRSLGFTVKDVDGHAGHAEFGTGQEMIAAFGHLDVVPPGSGWNYPEYGAEIHDGYIYARGASDDKGPTYAALYAAKALMDSSLSLNRRVRTIFGCNEESGFGCVKHYWEIAGEERPLMGFTPDASFPIVYAEKGIANLTIQRPLSSPLSTLNSQLALTQFRGGQRPNMVPDSAEARIEGSPAALAEAIKQLKRHWDKNVSYTADDHGVTLRSAGKSAHAAKPHAGDNAIQRLTRALIEIDMTDYNPWLEWLDESAQTNGEGLGIRAEDNVAGPLTSNLALIELEKDTLHVTYNVRYLSTWSSIGDLLNRLNPVLASAGWELIDYSDSPPLYVPLDEEPARTLLRVYQEETQDYQTQPNTMGGGTYARATPRSIAFGAQFPAGTDGPAHESDERISIENLIRATKIYAHALYELAK